MSLESVIAQLNQKNHLPPVEKWHPSYCGEIDICIKADGQWYYQGTVFKRTRLVKLLASVLIKQENDYFLITPVEKIKIQVEDAPFVITEWYQQENNQLVVKTNLDDVFEINQQHQVTLADNDRLYVTVRKNLTAKVHRNVYYQWIECAEQKMAGQQLELWLTSGNYTFCIGRVSESL